MSDLAPFDSLLSMQYEEGDEGRAAVAATGMVYEHCLVDKICSAYPFRFEGGINDGARLMLLLHDRQMRLAQWSFTHVSAPIEAGGVTYVIDDLLVFTHEPDMIAATLLLASDPE